MIFYVKFHEVKNKNIKKLAFVDYEAQERVYSPFQIIYSIKSIGCIRKNITKSTFV